jgi:hypothetical protein
MFGLFFDNKDGGYTFLRNVGELLPSCKALQPKIIYSSFHDILSDLVTATLNLQQISKYVIAIKGRDIVVGIATVYGLNDRGVGIPLLVGSRIFSSPSRRDRPRGPPSLLSNVYR